MTLFSLHDGARPRCHWANRVCLVLVLLTAACKGSTPESVTSSKAPCRSDADCSNGEACRFPETSTCGDPGECLTKQVPPVCFSEALSTCGCDGSIVPLDHCGFPGTSAQPIGAGAPRCFDAGTPEGDGSLDAR